MLITFRIGVFTLLSLVFCSFLAQAHTFKPSNASVDLLNDDEFALTLEVDLIELLQWQLELKADNSDELIEIVRQLSPIELYRALSKSKLTLAKGLRFYFDDQVVSLTTIFAPTVSDVTQLLKQPPDNTDYRVVFSGFGIRPKQAKTLALYFPEQLGVINFQLASPTRALLSSGVKTDAFNLLESNTSELAITITHSLNYLWQGIIHIVPKGLDHILFVLALFLFSTRLSSLLWQVSAFTLAHTVTLALGIYGVLIVPASIVEPIIALSIAYVAFENIIHHKLKSYRLLLVFLFGLLHGLGFASVLLELGLPQNQALASLISFNIGVELGQLSIILLAFLLLGWARNKPYYQTKIANPLNILIALVGCYWFFERLMF